MTYNFPQIPKTPTDRSFVSYKKRKKQREAVLEILVKEIFYDRCIDPNELEGIRLFSKLSDLPKCCVLRIKKKAFRNYVNMHLNHPKVSDKQIDMLKNIARLLGIKVDDIYDLADHPKRYCYIFKPYKIKSNFRRRRI